MPIPINPPLISQAQEIGKMDGAARLLKSICQDKASEITAMYEAHLLNLISASE